MEQQTPQELLMGDGDETEPDDGPGAGDRRGSPGGRRSGSGDGRGSGKGHASGPGVESGDVVGPEASGAKTAVPTGPSPEAEDRRVSREAQRRFLPRTAPRVEGWDLAAGTTALEEGGGETVWDWVELQGGRTTMLVYQVQGRGLPASHQLSAVRGAVRALAPERKTAGTLLPGMNRAMAAATVEGQEQFVACGTAVIGPEELEWGSAGRLPAGVIRRNGTFEELESHGPPLGMMDGFRYGSATVRMGPGDVFLALSSASSGLLRGAADLVAQVQGRMAKEVVEALHRALRKADEAGDREVSVLFMRKH